MTIKNLTTAELCDRLLRLEASGQRSGIIRKPVSPDVFLEWKAVREELNSRPTSEVLATF
jgi:hypothetical protein